MKEKIGNVLLNYSFYDGKDYYSDGDKAEEELLGISKQGNWHEVLHSSNKWPILYHFSDVRGNIIEWYPFERNATVLELGSGCGAISGFLCKKVKRVVGIELSKRRSLINAYRNRECDNLEIIVGNFKEIEIDEKFDYITLIGVFEYAVNYIGGENPYEDMLKRIKSLLKPDGKVFIAIENKMGLKYFNGAKEDHVGKTYVGLEDYRYVNNVRTFSKQELTQIMENSGFDKYEFYYPYPDYKLPDTIYSDRFLPSIGDIRFWGKNYDMTRVAFYNDAIMGDQVCRDKMFDYFSNSFLVICNEEENPIVYAHYSNERKEEYQSRTTIVFDRDKKTAKKVYLQEINRKYDIFETMRKYAEMLSKQFPNIKYVPANVSESTLEYDFIEGVTLESEIFKWRHNIHRMLETFSAVIREYMVINEDFLIDFEVTREYLNFFGNNVVRTKEKSLRVTNLDMLLHNLILKDDKLFCIDYEWIVDFPVPFEYVLYRCIISFYGKYNMYFSQNISKKEMLVSLGIKEQNISVYVEMDKCFSYNAYGENDCGRYLQNYKKSSGVIEIKGL